MAKAYVFNYFNSLNYFNYIKSDIYEILFYSSCV